MIAFALRPPPSGDAGAAAYKDWLHLNVFDHRSGAVGLFNGSLHGSPSDARSRAVGTALLHTPEDGWLGNMEVEAIALAPSIEAVSLARTSIAVTAGGDVLVSARLPEDAFEARVAAHPISAAFAIEQSIPCGSGWIAWELVPRLALTGRIAAGTRRLDLAGASAYHDHNWGRWHWGDDIGWEWGVFVSAAPSLCFVASRVGDRAHRRQGRASCFVDGAGLRRRFAGGSVSFQPEGLLREPLRRLPGALAALHDDRSAPALPRVVRIAVDDGFDRVEIVFRARAGAQIIAADPQTRGTSFIHEIAGDFEAAGRLAGRELRCAGLALLEYVD